MFPRAGVPGDGGREDIVKIAYQGEPGAYSEAAALRFRPDAEAVACPAFDDVFEAVERQIGRAHV